MNTVPITRVALPVITNEGLLSTISRHFGKAPGFIIVDSDGTRLQYIDSAEARRESECAPIHALIAQGCRALICHKMGRGALIRSHEHGLLIYAAAGRSTVVEALEAFRNGLCPDLPDSALCGHGHEHSHNSLKSELDCHEH